jgi:hypothetical protein
MRSTHICPLLLIYSAYATNILFQLNVQLTFKNYTTSLMFFLDQPNKVICFIHIWKFFVIYIAIVLVYV